MVPANGGGAPSSRAPLTRQRHSLRGYFWELAQAKLTMANLRNQTFSPERIVLPMTDDDASADSAERRTFYRVSLVAAGLIAAGLSLGAWEDNHDARSHLPHMTVAGQRL